MTSATPTRPAQERSPLVVIGLVALAAIVVVALLVWAFFASGLADRIDDWMHDTAIGSLVRYVLESLLLLVCVLLSSAAMIYGERKIWAAVQLRRGPNVVGPWGVLQPFADFLKFMLKEPIIPASANKGVFVLAPLVSVVLAIAAWAQEGRRRAANARQPPFSGGLHLGAQDFRTA